MIRRVAIAFFLFCDGGGIGHAQDIGACRAAEGEAAIAACTAALATRLAPAEAAEAYRRRALARVAKRDAAAAVADFGEALKRRPGSAADLIGRGRALLLLKDWRRAIADFDAALRLEPGNQDAYLWRGDAYLALGQPDRALRDYREVTQRAHRYPGVNRRLGDAYLAKKNIVEAYRSYRAELEYHPGDAEAKASLDRLQGAYDEVECDPKESTPDEAACTRLIDSGRYAGRQLARSYLRRGEGRNQSNNFQLGIADLTTAIRLDPGNDRAYAARGWLQSNYGDKALALADFDAAIARNPRVAAYWSTRANLHADAGRRERALADFTGALRLAPRDVQLLASRADLLMAAGRYREVVADASAALARLPRKNRMTPDEVMYGRLMMLLGQAYEKLGDKARAIAAYQAAAATEVERPEGAEEALKRLGAPNPERNQALDDCRNAYAFGNPNEAVELCTQALATPGLAAKDAAAARQRRAEGYFWRGEHERAWTDYEAAIRADPRSAELHYERAQLFRARAPFLDRVLADCAAAIRLNPRYQDAYELRADLYETVTKDYAKAIEDLTALMRVASNPVPHRERRGRLYAELGRLREAIADFNAVLAKGDRFDARLGRARAFAALGQLDRALADFDQAIAMSPEASGALRERAAVLTRKGDHDRAAADFAEALALNANDAAARKGLTDAMPSSPAIAALRRCFVESGAAARDACTAAAAAGEASAARRSLALFGRARHRFAAEDLAGAIADANAAAELRAGFGRALYLRARARLESGEYAAAATEFFRAGIYNGEGRAYYALALLGKRELRFAVDQYGFARGYDAGHPVVIGVGGAIREAWEDRPGAIADYRRALGVDATLHFVRRGLRRLEALEAAAATPDALACESGAEAVAACDRVIADSALPARVRAWALVRRGSLRLDDEPATALADFDAALALAGDIAAAHYGRGAALLALQRHGEAVAALGAALALNPDSANALIARAGALHAMGRSGDALPDADKALAVRNDFVSAYLTRARIHEKLGNLKAARADLAKALDIDPKQNEARAALERLEDK